MGKESGLWDRQMADSRLGAKGVVGGAQEMTMVIWKHEVRTAPR